MNAIWHEPASYSPEQLAITDWPLLSQILLARGITSKEQAFEFLNAERRQPGDPYLLPDMSRAVDLIRQELENGGLIGIFGDYDVDGLSSTAMLTRVIARLGGQPFPIIPHRMRDGYGLNVGAIERFIDVGVRLMIVVDCGSSDLRELDFALENGIQPIILDHHRVRHELPDPVAFVSTRRAANQYPETELAAVGVAYALVRALLGDEDAEMYLPYVALGTVADIVTLQDENRALATRGIDMLRRWQLPGFNVLCQLAGLKKRELSAWDIGFVIGPRINAAGRMDTPQIALDWFLANDVKSAEPYAARLNQLNLARQAETRRVTDEAEQQAELLGGSHNFPALVLADASWGIGVAGIVAGRIAERYNRPAIILERKLKLSTGSARSAGNIDVVSAIGQHENLLERFGGHTAAAGLSIPTENIDLFRERFSESVLDQWGGVYPRREIVLDAEVDHGDLNLDTVSRLQVLEPTGHGNKPPRFLVRNLKPVNIRLSRDGSHLLFNVQDRAGYQHDATFFRHGERFSELSELTAIDVACSLERNSWNGRVSLQLNLVDFRPHM